MEEGVVSRACPACPICPVCPGKGMGQGGQGGQMKKIVITQNNVQRSFKAQTINSICVLTDACFLIPISISEK